MADEKKSPNGRLILPEQLRFFSELGVTHLRIPVSGEAGQEKEPDEASGTNGASKPPMMPREESLVGEQEASGIVTLEVVRQELGDCQRCKLAPRRINLVFGTGSQDADLMFVGEAPGEQEDIQGLPFVGPAGQLLSRIIEAIGLKREQVYIANILKCRPPENRNPQPDEVEACEPFLFKQIEVIQPMIVVALGKYAAQTLLRTTTPISRMRGQLFDFRGSKLIPTFHPSYLLRNPSSKREVWEDMKKVRSLLQENGSKYYK